MLSCKLFEMNQQVRSSVQCVLRLKPVAVELFKFFEIYKKILQSPTPDTAKEG